MDEMTPLQIAAYEDAGNVFRSEPGASRSVRDTTPQTGIVRNPRTGLSVESSWRNFFGERQQKSDSGWGLHGKEPTALVRPVPQQDQEIQVMPPSMEGGAQAWDRSGQPTAVPGSAGAALTRSGTTFIDPKYGTGFVRNQNDPLRPFTFENDLTTTDGLMADASQTYNNLLGGTTPSATPPPASSAFEEDF